MITSQWPTSFLVWPPFASLASLTSVRSCSFLPNLPHSSADIRQNNSLTDQGLHDALIELPGLQLLELLACTSLTGELIEDGPAPTFINTLGPFQGWSLSISLCPLLKSKCLAEAICANPSIRSLCLSELGMTVEHLHSILSSLKGLRRLDLSGYGVIWNALPAGPHLFSLRLQAVTDFAIQPVRHMAALEHLILSYCNGITGEVFDKLEPGAMLMLKTLDIAGIFHKGTEAQTIFNDAIANLTARFQNKLIVVTERSATTTAELYAAVGLLNQIRAASGRRTLKLK